MIMQIELSAIKILGKNNELGSPVASINDGNVSRNLAESIFKCFDEKPEKEQKSSQKKVVQYDLLRILSRQHNLKLDYDQPEKIKYNRFIERVKEYKESKLSNC
jgi:hypothetical protein